MTTFNLITIFPNIYTSFLNESLIKKAIDKQLLKFNIVDLKNFGLGNYNKVDDTEFGGAPGMVLRIDCLVNALESVEDKGAVILMSAKGKKFTQKQAFKFAEKEDTFTIINGRFEGVDERILNYVDYELNMGSFITMGGEVLSMAFIEAIARLKKGVIKNYDSVLTESFSKGTKKDYPKYTKPRVFRELEVPEVLYSGDHKKISKWRKDNSI